MTLENYILEQDISTASISDIEADQIYAEMQVACALVDVYLKQAVIQEYSQTDISEFELYTESDSKIKEKLTNAGTAIKNFFKKIIEALYRFTRMIIDKIRGQEFSAAIKKLKKMDPNTVLTVDIVPFETVMTVLDQSKMIVDMFDNLSESVEISIKNPAELQKMFDKVKKSIAKNIGKNIDEVNGEIIITKKQISVADLTEYYLKLQDKTVIDELRYMNKTLGKLLKSKTPGVLHHDENVKLFKDICNFLIMFYNRYTKTISKTTKYILTQASNDKSSQESSTTRSTQEKTVSIIKNIRKFPTNEVNIDARAIAQSIVEFAESIDENNNRVDDGAFFNLKDIITNSNTFIIKYNRNPHFTTLNEEHLFAIKELNKAAKNALKNIHMDDLPVLIDDVDPVLIQCEKVLNLLKENNE